MATEPRQHPGSTVLELVYGSHAHGTNTPTSDIDTRGVYLLPNDSFLGLGRPQTTWEHKPTDTVFWELGHFVQLLCKGNPNIVGMLYTPIDCVLDHHQIANDLVLHRSLFLTQEFRRAYMGWIHRESQDIAKLHKGHAKRLSHVPRLIWELMSVYETGEMVVRPTIAKRDIIKLIKTGDMDYDEAVRFTGELLLELENLDAVEGPRLPDMDRGWANDWLLDTRRRWG